MPESRSTPIIFSIATNGYDVVFADWIRTHEQWCERQGYEYYCFNESPPKGIDANLSAWSKVFILFRLLEMGHQWVGFLDADTRIDDRAPDFRADCPSGRSVFCVLERDGRPNSGVIFTRREGGSVRFFRLMSFFVDVPGRLLPKRDANLFENGAFNFFSRKFPTTVGFLDRKWNNNTGEPMGEYIWHSAGRHHLKPRVSPTRAPVEKRPLKGFPRRVRVNTTICFWLVNMQRYRRV